jgi:hypothetical protein
MGLSNLIDLADAGAPTAKYGSQHRPLAANPRICRSFVHRGFLKDVSFVVQGVGSVRISVYL